MDYTHAEKLQAALKQQLLRSRRNHPELPDEMIISGNPGDGYKLVIISDKDSGINNVVELPNELIEKAETEARKLGMTIDVEDIFDVKESRVARAPARTAMTK